MSYKKIYVKITTLPQTEDIDVNSLEYKVYKKKYIEAREFMKDQDVIYSYYSDSAKNPSFGKIYSINIGYLMDDTTLRIKTLKGEEKELLESFLNILKSKDFNNSKLITYNLGFTLSFITIRMMKNGLDISSVPKQLINLDQKPWNIKDANGVSDALKGIGWFQQNMLELSYLAGLNTNLIDGSEVWYYYRASRQGEIDNSDVLYLQNICNLDRIIEGEDKILNISVAADKKEDKIELPPVLEVIYNENNISKESKKRLLELLGKKRLIKKDKPKIITILHSLSVNSEMFKGDKPEVIQEKLEKVEKLIEEL